MQKQLVTIIEFSNDEESHVTGMKQKKQWNSSSDIDTFPYGEIYQIIQTGLVILLSKDQNSRRSSVSGKNYVTKLVHNFFQHYLYLFKIVNNKYIVYINIYIIYLKVGCGA